jgi:hypothetical protein
MSNHSPIVAALALSAVTLLALLAPLAPASAATTLFSFTDDFSSRNTSKWDYIGEWGSGSTVYATNLSQMGGYALYARADKKTSSVGKAYLSKDAVDAYKGYQIEASMDVYFGYLPTDSASTYVLDIECRDCGWSSKPGIRVLIDSSRRIRVNRDKLKVSGEFRSSAQVPLNKKFRLTMRVTLGEGSSGRTQVLIDGKTVIDEAGTNMPLKTNFKNKGINLTAERFNYVQAGITANSHNTSVTGYYDNVSITVRK